jgi:hypothetical protein
MQGRALGNVRADGAGARVQRRLPHQRGDEAVCPSAKLRAGCVEELGPSASLSNGTRVARSVRSATGSGLAQQHRHSRRAASSCDAAARATTAATWAWSRSTAHGAARRATASSWWARNADAVNSAADAIAPPAPKLVADATWRVSVTTAATPDGDEHPARSAQRASAHSTWARWCAWI